MIETTLVSVIMPAYNAAQFIEMSIQSVIKQDYTNWELIIIDDGSTDKTQIIISRFLNEDDRIKYFYKENEGQGIAKNYGIEKASGELIAFLDSDDYWFPNKLSLSMQEFLTNSQDLLFTQAYLFSENVDLLDVSGSEYIGEDKETIYKGTDGISSFIVRNRVPILTVLVKKELLLSLNGFPNIHIAEDYYLWLKLLLENYTIRGINLPLSAYRVHNNSIMKEKVFDICEVIEMIILLSKDYPKLLIKYKKETKQRILFYLNNVFTDLNHKELKYYMKNLKHYSYLSRIIFCFHNIIPFRFFKRLMRKSIIFEKC